MSEVNQVSAEQLEICEYTTTVADSTTSTLQKPLTPGQDYAYVLTDLLPEQIPYKGIMIFTSKVGSNNFLPESCLDCRPEVDWNYYTETTTKFVQQHGYDPCGCRTCGKPKLVTTTRKVELDCCNEENCRFEIVLYNCREKVQGCDNLWLFTGLKRGLSRTECSLESDVARATEHFAGEQVLINPWTHFHDCCRQAMINDCSRVWPCFGVDGLLHYDDQGTFSLYCDDVWPCFNSSHGVENWIENGQMFFGVKIADDALIHWSEDDPNAIDLRCNDVRPCFSSWGLLHYDVSTGSFGFDCDDVRSCFSACGGISYNRFTGEFQSNFATTGVGMEITQGSDCTIYFENTEPSSKATFQYYERNYRTGARQPYFPFSENQWGTPELIDENTQEDGKAIEFDLANEKVALINLQGRLHAALSKVCDPDGSGGKACENQPLNPEFVTWFSNYYLGGSDINSTFIKAIPTPVNWAEWKVWVRFRIIDGKSVLYTWPIANEMHANMFMGENSANFSLSCYKQLPAGPHSIAFQVQVGGHNLIDGTKCFDYFNVKCDEAHIDLGFVDSAFIRQPD